MPVNNCASIGTSLKHRHWSKTGSSVLTGCIRQVRLERRLIGVENRANELQLIAHMVGDDESNKDQQCIQQRVKARWHIKISFRRNDIGAAHGSRNTIDLN